MLSNRNCFKLLVKMITASPIARCPSFKFLTMQREPSHHGRGIADRSIRDHHVRRQAAPPLTILPPVTALAIGLPAQRAIAQRFSAMARSGRPPMLAIRPLSGGKWTSREQLTSVALGPTRTSAANLAVMHNVQPVW